MALSVTADLMLHGSTVTDGDVAWSFVGVEGTGKSTIAAAMFDRKYGVLSDDASRLQMSSGRIAVSAGVPEVRLFAETFRKVFPQRSLDETSAVLRKRRLRTESIANGSAPLKAFYCLNPSAQTTKVSVKPITPVQALQMILPNIFRFDLWNRNLRERELLNLTRLVEAVPAFEVNYPFEWQSFSELIDSLERSMKHL